MTAKIDPGSLDQRASLCDQNAVGKAACARLPGQRADGSIVCRDLVKERVAQALGIRIPLSRSLVGGKRRRPERGGAVAAGHRQGEAIVEKQFRPFPPGAELLQPPEQVLTA